MRLITAGMVRSASGEALGDAVLVDGDKIVAVGAATDLRSADVEDQAHLGATIVPGLRDAHLHPIGYAAALSRPSLKEAADFDHVAETLAAAAAALPAGAAVTALRLDDESLAEGRLPDRHLLDRAVPDRPVLVVRYCGHIAVANTAALEVAGLSGDTPDPAGGSLDRDSAGNPTGVLRETAIEPVTAAVRPLAPPVTTDEILSAMTALASVGLVGAGAMVATDAGCWAGAGSELDALLDAAPRSPIALDVFVIARSPAELRDAADRLRTATGRIRFAGVKMFSDGSLGGHTAAMHSGFADRPDEIGTDRLDPAWARKMAEASVDLGGRVAIHAIGDRANGAVLDLMESLIEGGAEPGRLRIEHASVLTEDDIVRLGRSGITASVQPAFIASETEWLEKRLGAERLRLTYPFRSLASAGAPLAGGSDSPVEPPHPLWGMAAARDRLGIVTVESLTPEATLASFTSGAAAATGRSSDLTEGASPDLTIIDTDPVAGTPDALRSARVLATVVDGARTEIPEGLEAWQA